MPLPAGISTKTVTYGIPLDITGAQGVLNDVTVKPDRDLVWTATGQTIYAKEFAASVSAGGTITVDLPPVDHAGFKDTAGADITYWSYTIAGRIRIGNQSRTFSRDFQILSTDPATIDLDLIPVGTSVPAVESPELPWSDARIADLVDDDATPSDVRAALDTLLGTKVGKGELVLNVRDYGAVGDGVTDDRAAIVAAMNAATAAGYGCKVFLPPGRYKIVGSLSMSGQTCSLEGAGASFSGSLGAGIGQGTVLLGSAQTGPVLDFIGYVWPTDHRGRLSFGNFTIEGDNTADATKAHSGIRMGNTSGDSPKGARFHDIVIAKTGGPGLDMTRAYLCEFERITVVTPVGAQTNDVPYILGKNVNANIFSRIGLRSVTTSADCGASGAVVIQDDGTYPSYDNVFDALWIEFLHIPTGGCIFKLKGNRNILRDFSYNDINPETAATDTAMIRIEPSGVSDFGGNIVRGHIPGGDGTSSYPTYGIVVSQSRNRIEGIKGWKGNNIRLLSGTTNCTVILGGAESGATNVAFVDNSGSATHVLIDHMLRTSVVGGISQDERTVAQGAAGPRFYDSATVANGALWLGQSNTRLQVVGATAYMTADTLNFRDISTLTNRVQMFTASNPALKATSVANQPAIESAGFLRLSSGGIRRFMQTKTANYTMNWETDDVIVANGTSITVTLPSAALAAAGRAYTIKNINSTSCSVATTSSQTIDGAASDSLAQWAIGRYMSDGTNWLKV